MCVCVSMCKSQIYQLQCELRKAQTETDFQQRRSLRCVSPSQSQQLREEISTLRRKIMEAETFSPVRPKHTHNT